MSTILMRLQPQFRNEITDEFLYGQKDLDLEKYLQDAEPGSYDIADLLSCWEKCKELFSGRPEESDSWFAPRVHAALRLTRREAADQGIWDWLAMGPLLDYVRWRFSGVDDKVVAARFVSKEKSRQAISRLWWGAELTRNGDDYSCTEILFSRQEINNSWAVTRFMRNRAAAIAGMRFLNSYSKNGVPKDTVIKTLDKAIRASLATTVLESLCQSENVSVDAVESWRSVEIDSTLWNDTVPEGPPEPKVNEQQVQAALDWLEGVGKHATGCGVKQTAIANDEVQIEKILSKNDTGETGGHQAGIHVPLDSEILGFFPELDRETKNPRAVVSFLDETGQKWDFNFIYYNNKFFGGTRNECRLTGLTQFMSSRSVKSGDRIKLTRKGKNPVYFIEHIPVDPDSRKADSEQQNSFAWTVTRKGANDLFTGLVDD